MTLPLMAMTRDSDAEALAVSNGTGRQKRPGVPAMGMSFMT